VVQIEVARLIVNKDARHYKHREDNEVRLEVAIDSIPQLRIQINGIIPLYRPKAAYLTIILHGAILLSYY